MMYKNLISRIIPGVLIMAIITAFVFRFVTAGTEKNENIEKISEILLTDLAGNHVSFVDLISEERDTYVLVMEPRNCPPCIHKGIEDLAGLKKSGSHCLAIVVHNWPEEVKGWTGNYDFSPFFVIPGNRFHESFNISYLPALLKIRNSRLKNIRYITN